MVNVEMGDKSQAMARGKRCRGNRNGEERYKKRIIIFLFTRAMLGTLASR